MFPIQSIILILMIIHKNNAGKNEILKTDHQFSIKSMELLLQEIMVKTLIPYKCVCMISDDIYSSILQQNWFRRFSSLISFIIVKVKDWEDLLVPSKSIHETLLNANHEGCQLYIILISNGQQAIRLLRFGDRYRVINTRSKFIILFDNRLFDKKWFYLWRRIIDVIFIKQYGGYKSGLEKKVIPWFEISTVPFPSPIASIFIPKRLDIWTNERFRKGTHLFRDKTQDLHNQTLKVAIFPHIPGSTKYQQDHSKVRAKFGGGSFNFSGAEIEILQTVSNAMNFRSSVYEPPNIDIDLWGGKQGGAKYTGLIAEMVYTHADIALGDLYYTPYILDLMDLSIPYNTECLTFLTPESLTDNSWKTLILPFKPAMWGAVIICLIVSAFVFHFLARFHHTIDDVIIQDHKKQVQKMKKKRIVTLSIYSEEKIDADLKYSKMREQYVLPKYENQPMGLYQFTEPVNSLLYTYSMLLLVSLPKLPTGWSLRMLTGWYWLYCLLLVVAYRASMTAILSRPTPRVTIDTLQELLDSKLPCGGWGEINKDFFKTSLDPALKEISNKFEIINDSDTAVDRVAQGKFAFYENIYFLKEAQVKRQIRFQAIKSNSTTNQTQSVNTDRTLHIMSDCVIKMPISIGLQKNSPIKPRVDKIIRRVLEAGLIKKWLDDVMQNILNTEIQDTGGSTKAIMSMKKFFGALVALFIGYFISICVLFVEIIYFNHVIKKKPGYNKYSKKIEVIKEE